MRLYVGGLPYQTTEHDLIELFEQVGQVTEVSVITDRDTGRSKGFGFVEMATEEEATKAIGLLNSREIEGRALTVNEARPQQPRGEGFGGGGGGRRGGGGGFGGRGDRGGFGGGGGKRQRW